MLKVLDDFSLADLNFVKKSEISKPCQISEGILMRTVGNPAAIKILDSSTLTNKKIPPFFLKLQPNQTCSSTHRKVFFINPSESQSC
jgi:hypothetical protein